MVLALQTAYSLPQLGVKYYIGTVVSKSLVRELGPVLIALIVGGRVGSGMTAEIGTMKVSEQIDALRSMGADPVKKLVAPKLVAMLLMFPVLTILGDAMGILGGLVVARWQLGISGHFYLNDVFSSLYLSDVMSGVGKSVFFAYFITMVGCYNGFTARGGADGVGRATTRTVVLASIMVLVSDFFLTKLFYLLA
jgi:phospholipid/cholesterol/gamma-HCH transport system permease protein